MVSRNQINNPTTMKTLTNLALTCLFTTLLTTISPAAAVAVVDDSSTYTPGANDIYNLFTYNAASKGYEGTHSFTNQDPGQTFETGSSAGNLTSVTLQESGGQSSTFQTASNTYALGIFSVSGSTLTYLGGNTFTFNNVDPGTGNFYTLNLTTPIALSANTEYAFLFDDSTGGSYTGLVSSGSAGAVSTYNTYTNGTAINGTAAALSSQSFTTPTLAGNTFDHSFDIGISVPEPSMGAMILGGMILLLVVVMQRFRRQNS